MLSTYPRCLKCGCRCLQRGSSWCRPLTRELRWCDAAGCTAPAYPSDHPSAAALAGIPADKVDAVLNRGVRADATTPGHGIGLAVVWGIVIEAYGGEITVGASDLDGAAVTIRIPLRQQVSVLP